MFLFPFNKRKVISEVWVLAASNSFGSVFEVKAVATGKCQRVDFRFQPLFQTDPVLPPGGACGWPCLVFILCLAMVPGSTSWPCRRLPLRPLGESWAAHLLSPVSCLTLFQVSFFAVGHVISFFLCPERCHLTRSGVSVVPFSVVLCFNQLPSSGFLDRWEISFSKWEISSTVGINVC